MEEIKIGDLIVKRTIDIGGLEIRKQDSDEMLCFLNEGGMRFLARWINSGGYYSQK